MNTITVAGSALTDLVKTIDAYPQRGMLTDITAVRQTVGGCVPNTAVDLKRLAPELCVTAAGRVGKDAFGAYLRERLAGEGVRAAFAEDEKRSTGFTDVMTLKNGERTFFHARGANAAFSADDLPEEALDCDLFHLGYLLLLDRLDAADAFCAGMLYAFMKGLPMEEGLSLVSLCAACNLSSDDSVGGARSLAQTLALEKQFKRRKL